MPLTGEAKRAYMRRYSAANKERENARCRKWRQENLDYAKEYQKAYAKANPEVNKVARDKYRAKPDYNEKARVYANSYRAANRDKHNSYCRSYKKGRYHSDPSYQILCRLRARLQKKLLNRGIRKVWSTMALTGCTTEFLRGYLEGQFKPGMTWDNIHIDHHIPCSAFDLTDPKQQLQCFHFSNLRPMWPSENLFKGTKLPSS